MSVDLVLGTTTNVAQPLNINDNGTLGTPISLPSATTSLAGLMSADDKAKMIKQGGNAFGTEMTIGTDDPYIINLKTQGAVRMYIQNSWIGLNRPLRNGITQDNSIVDLRATGTVISRNIADANPALLVNQQNAGSTGNILTLQKSGTDQLTVDYQGNLTVLGTIKSTSGMGPLSLSGAPGVKISSTGYGSVLSTTYLTADRTVQMPNAGGTSTVIGTTAPASATDTGVVGEIRVTSTYVYVCIATDTWVRAPFATW